MARNARRRSSGATASTNIGSLTNPHSGQNAGSDYLNDRLSARRTANNIRLKRNRVAENNEEYYFNLADQFNPMFFSAGDYDEDADDQDDREKLNQDQQGEGQEGENQEGENQEDGEEKLRPQGPEAEDDGPFKKYSNMKEAREQDAKDMMEDAKSIAKIRSGDAGELAKFVAKKLNAYRNLPRDVKKFIGVASALAGPVGTCPHCKNKSVFISSRFGDLAWSAITGSLGVGSSITFYCMNRHCKVMAWTKGKCYRKKGPKIGRVGAVFEKDPMTAERTRILRIDG